MEELKQKEMWISNARWITANQPVASPVICRRFTYHGGKAVFQVSGLGYFEAYINGQKVGNEYFQPNQTDYFKRDYSHMTYRCVDTFSYRIFYCTYDITSLVKSGENLLEIQLGGGWFIQKERLAEGDLSYSDRTQCIYALKLEDCLLFSDGSEQWHPSCIIYSNLFIGEIIDSRIDTTKLYPVELLPTPESTLCPQEGIPDRKIGEIIPRELSSVGGKRIFDCGRNISGWVKVTTKTKKGEKITLRFAELLNEDGSLDFASTGGVDYTCQSGKKQIMTDEFIGNGTEETFSPKFVWHAFRYFEVEGSVEQVIAEIIHTDAPITATFHSDSPTLNFLFDAYTRTLLNNMHGNVPLDCPHRERLGYTGDGQLSAPSAMMLLDTKEFYRKWIQDILDGQDDKTGHIQHTAPFEGGGGGPGGWGCAVITVPYHYWKQFGECSMLEKCYLPMKKWIHFMKNNCKGDLLVSESEGGWCLGDWLFLPSGKVPEAFANTCCMIQALRKMITIAKVLEKREDIPQYEKMLTLSLEALRPFIEENKNSNVIMAYAAWVGLADASVCAEGYRAYGHLDTGIIATEFLFDILFQNGYGDVAFQLMDSSEIGSFRYMSEHGATTLWEFWDGKVMQLADWQYHGSHDHPMFGACTRQLFHGILGVRQTEASAGWEKVTFSPCLPKEMNFAEGSFQTPKGTISVSLRRIGDHLEKHLSLPEGITLTEA